MDFLKSQDAAISPLAINLFRIEGVNRVFYGKDYISIAKSEKVDWEKIQPLIFETIQDFYNLDQPLFNNDQLREDTKINDNDSEIVQTIKEIIETRVRPMLAEDGGDIVFKEFDE